MAAERRALEGSSPATSASLSWSTQQLAEFLATVSSFQDEQTAKRGAVERAAEALEAEVGVLVSRGSIVASVGFPHQQVPASDVLAVAEGRRDRLDVPGIGCCATAVAPLEDEVSSRLVLARAGRDPFGPDEVNLLRGMARVLTLAVRMLAMLESERGLRRQSQGQVEENARLLQSLRERQEAMEHQAFHDSLTGLPNRALLLDRLEHALARRESEPVSVLFLDLDSFKVVNDSLGHEVGDQVLVAVAERLVECLHPADTAARFGGDEFALLIEDSAGPSDAARLAERVLAALRMPFVVGEREIFVSASIGIASGYSGAGDLLRDADAAMYKAKGKGRGRYEVFEPRMRAAVVERLELEADLRRALDREELTLHYQPIVRLRDRAIVGVEALVRWRHPRRGLVLPDAFIPLAEETRLILPIGRWVLREACRQAVAWQDRHPHTPVPTMSVNISGTQLQGARFVDEVAEILAETGLEASRLVLEITETVLMNDTDTAIAKLERLKALGVGLAIDDFGTGYSSLMYLRGFPVDTLKIAKTFVDGTADGSGNAALAQAIVDLGSSLRLRTVAEGIEQPGQLARLRALGCELGQGYLFAPPLDAPTIEALLRRPSLSGRVPLSGMIAPAGLRPAADGAAARGR